MENRLAKETYDGAIPCGSSVIAMALQKPALLTGETKWQDAADRQMQFPAASIHLHPSASCFGVLAMMEALYPHRELICAAKGGLPPQLEEYLSEHPTYGLEVLLKTEDNAEALSSCASFPKDYPIPKSGALYYLCENGVC